MNARANKFGRIAAICTVKDEGPYILEWLGWCRLVGFTDFYIAQNDSTDGTAELLSCLQDAGLINFIDNSFLDAKGKRPLSYQFRAYLQCLHWARKDGVNWAMAVDVDEFVYVYGENGLGRIESLLLDGADEVRLNWRHMGSLSAHHFSEDFLTSRFISSKPLDNICKFGTLIKTLFRLENVDVAGFHKPNKYRQLPQNPVNGSGLPVEDLNAVCIEDPGGCSNAFIGHYQTRDLESFLMKRVRGNANALSEQVYNKNYWDTANAGTFDLKVLADEQYHLAFEVQKIDRLTKGKAMELHKRSVANWKRVIGDLRRNPDVVDFATKIDPTYCPHRE